MKRKVGFEYEEDGFEEQASMKKRAGEVRERRGRVRWWKGRRRRERRWWNKLVAKNRRTCVGVTSGDTNFKMLREHGKKNVNVVNQRFGHRSGRQKNK